MKVLLAASEAAPIVKLGGLGDVIGSLPKALQKKGVNIDVIIPYYPIADVQESKIYQALELEIPFDGQIYSVGIYKTKLPNSDVDVFLIRNSKFFSLGGESAFLNTTSETEMFMFFNRAVVEFIKAEFNTYDLIHCNDWHTGLITHLLQDELAEDRPATLFTIHNIMYQGKGGVDLAEEVGFVPGEHQLIDWDLEDGDINMMLQGITSSDFVSTVSPSYAHEIVTEKYGGGFADILRTRSSRLKGILNGLDYSAFPRYYDVHNALEGKLEAKKKLAEKMGFSVDKPGSEGSFVPVFGFIGRLDPSQKGLDILHEFLLEFPEKFSDKHKAKFLILGVGDPIWESKFKDLADACDHVEASIVFDEELARLIYAGSDFLLVPSKYEPCGLIQLIGMWYGTIPVVHGVGGLRDSVKQGVTGLIFEKYSKDDLASAVERAINIYEGKEGEARLETMTKNAMREDFSWERSAELYKNLYERVINLHRLGR